MILGTGFWTRGKGQGVGEKGIQHGKLLIVDDEESLCRLLKDTFSKGGHKVDVVDSGQDAKGKVDSQAYDVIISDIRMPDVTGIELLEHARA